VAGESPADGGLYRCTRAEVERPSLRPVVRMERVDGRGGLALSGPDAGGVALGALYRLRLEEAGPGPENFTG
jgi:hypothetical protein